MSELGRLVRLMGPDGKAGLSVREQRLRMRMRNVDDCAARLLKAKTAEQVMKAIESLAHATWMLERAERTEGRL